MSIHKYQKVTPCGCIACTVFLVTSMLLGVIHQLAVKHVRYIKHFGLIYVTHLTIRQWLFPLGALAGPYADDT